MNSTQWGSYSFLFGPVMAMGGIGLLVLVLRWGWSRGESLVQRPITPANPTEYGMLRAVSAPPTVIEAEILRQTLEAADIKATVAMTNDGPRVMVWPKDEKIAKQILARRTNL